MTELIKIGYWWSEDEPHLPMPVANAGVVPTYEVLYYLCKGEILHSYMGWSTCRICGEMNGSTCLTDGVYQWPVGLLHYVEKHGIILDDDFIAHIKRQHGQPFGTVVVGATQVFFDPEDGTWD